MCVMSNNVKVNVWKLLESIRLIKGSCPCQTADGNSTALQLMWGWRLKIINWFCPHVEFGTKPLLFLVNRSFQTLNHPSPAKQSRVESKKASPPEGNALLWIHSTRSLLSAAADRRGSFPALSRKGSGSRGQCSIRPLLGGSQASMRPSVG